MKAVWHKLMKYKIWAVLGVVTIVAVKFGFTYLNSEAKVSANPQLVQAERGDLSESIAATGTIKPVNMVDISSKITAQIKEMKVKENEPVTAGQVLVVLEDAGLQAQVIQAQARLNNAATTFTRNQRLQQVGALSAQELDNSSMDYTTAQASYDEVVSKLNDSIITAPIDGVVIGKPLPAGQTVAQGVNNPTVILTIADMSKMQIEAQVDETDIGKISVGQKVKFTVDAYSDKQFTGVVSVISQKATVQQNVIYYTVFIDVDNPQNLLKPSMTARVEIVGQESKNTLNIPLAALHTDKDRKYVVVMGANGKTTEVPVTTGISEDGRIEIVSGVNEGDNIVMPQAKASGQSGQQPSSGKGNSNPLGGVMRRM